MLELLVALHFLKVLFRVMALELTVLEAEVVKLGFDLIIVIFRGMGGGCDNEAAAKRKVLVVLPPEGS